MSKEEKRNVLLVVDRLIKYLPKYKSEISLLNLPHSTKLLPMIVP